MMNGGVDSFYVFLPSSIISGPIENTQSHYITNLQNPIRLQGSYECGLSMIIYPASVNNGFDCRIRYYSFNFGIDMINDLSSSYYSDIQGLLDEINITLGPDQQYYKFSINTVTNKVMVEMNTDKVGGEVPYMEMSENLAALTGHPSYFKRIGYVIGDHSFDLTGGISGFYIYSNILESSYVGTSTAPLLAVIPYDFWVQHGSIQHWSPKKIHYILIRDSVIQQVKIEVWTKMGVYVPFSGKASETLIVLAIRCKPPSF